MSQIVIFAPSPVLTVTIEDDPDGPDVHFHAGGQGVWQARMLRRIGADVPPGQEPGSDADLLGAGFATVTSIRTIAESTDAALVG
mgnify:CR=1 FL=1